MIRPAVTLLAFFTLLLGVVYPLAVTGLAQVVFPEQANGSLVMVDGQVVGSALLGQDFSDPKYFFGRPSSTLDKPCNAASSSGSNLGPSNPALVEAAAKRAAVYRALEPSRDAQIPVELVMASASGLDPHISPAAAEYQVSRVARVRKLSEPQLRALIRTHTLERTFGFLGEPRVNVLELNYALDALR